MNFSYRDLILPPSATLLEAMKKIDSLASQIALIARKDDFLLGTLTDGDIRRALLNGEKLEASCEIAMNKSFLSFSLESGYASMQRIMKEKKIRHVPIVDGDGRVVSIVSLEEFEESNLPYPVLIMAGGKGTRLLPKTENCPKPMLPINGKPMLEILLERCISSGFREFYFSVNYLKRQITDYFGDGSKWGANIKYLVEDIPLGTAGSLSLMPSNIQEPFVVLNGDVLTKLDFSQILSFHNEHDADATLCVREYEYSVPFGVVNTSGVQLVGFEEKPTYRYMINAGVYVINPKLLRLLPKNNPIDMPDFLKLAKDSSHNVIACPIYEYWIDVGRHDTLKQAREDWI